MALGVPQQQLVFAQAAEHGVELGLVDEGEVALQFARRPFRRAGAQADLAQHHQAHHHLVVAAAEQRDHRADQRLGREQREELRHVGGLDARDEELGESVVFLLGHAVKRLASGWPR